MYAALVHTHLQVNKSNKMLYPFSISLKSKHQSSSHQHIYYKNHHHRVPHLQLDSSLCQPYGHMKAFLNANSMKAQQLAYSMPK